jgi:hypothetical protein
VDTPPPRPVKRALILLCARLRRAEAARQRGKKKGLKASRPLRDVRDVRDVAVSGAVPTFAVSRVDLLWAEGPSPVHLGVSSLPTAGGELGITMLE